MQRTRNENPQHRWLFRTVTVNSRLDLSVVAPMEYLPKLFTAFF